MNILRGVWFVGLAGKAVYDGVSAISKGEYNTGKANDEVIHGPEAYIRGALVIAGAVSLGLLAYECFFPREDADHKAMT